MLPNYTPCNWFESDVFEISKSGYMVEWEIKLSIADFRKDVEKNDTYTARGKKHDRLAARDPLGPSRFYYVAPKDMISRDLLPSWAGLWEVTLTGYKDHPVLMGEVVPAPRLHKEKVSQVVKDHALGVCYWRLMHRVSGDIHKLVPVMGEGNAPEIL